MLRNALSYLEKNWITDADRKPLVLRGARQVGKTWLVREFCKKTGKKLVEINCERDPQVKSLFESNNPRVIIQNMETYLGLKIDPTTSLLFVDEIQDAPHILAQLRWFYEEMPELAVIVAGSLLEFVLQSTDMSMPVGRITYMHLEPFSFEEFLHAQNGEVLLDYLQKIVPPFDIPSAIHQKLQNYFKQYLLIGGMPAAISHWVKHQSYEGVFALQQDLLATYRDDFFKYKGRFDVHKLDMLLNAIPAQLGQKFVCAKVDSSLQAASAKQILSLFHKARLCHIVACSSGNGVPLKAEVKGKAFKEVFLDVGLANQFLGGDASFSNPIIAGKMSEQVVGQMLRCLFPFYREPSLYYWQRETPRSSAEIDYLIECEDKVIPVEVKAGSTGSLKSLHLFMDAKQANLAVRINDDLPSVTHVKVNKENGGKIDYSLLSIPFYLTGQLHRLLKKTLVELNLQPAGT